MAPGEPFKQGQRPVISFFGGIAGIIIAVDVPDPQPDKKLRSRIEHWNPDCKQFGETVLTSTVPTGPKVSIRENGQRGSPISFPTQ